VQIHGTRGGAILEGAELAYWKVDRDVEVDVPPHPACAADDMVQALTAGRPLACDGYEGRKSLALVRAVYESARNGEVLIAFEGW
jgi:predicted dehydrogenase